MTTSSKLLPNLHILGIQGSGKGTQTQLLSDKYGLTVLSSGNLCRQRCLIDDDLGREISDLLRQGLLLPDEMILKIVREFLQDQPIPVGLIGEGVIRTWPQYELYQPLWSEHHLATPFLIHLQLDDETAKDRIVKRGSVDLVQRQDTDIAAIEQRIRDFHLKTEPILEQLSSSHQICHIDANQPIEVVFADITQAVDLFLSSHNEPN